MSAHVKNEVVNAKKNKNLAIIPYKIDDDNNSIMHHLSLLQWINATADLYVKFDELETYHKAVQKKEKELCTLIHAIRQ